MSDRQAGEVTQLLQQFRQGDTDAMSQLLPYIYDELKQIAGRCLQPQHVSWQPTALAHELFVHLFADETPDWKNREHFFATASLKMRNLLIDDLRRKQALKHGGEFHQIAFDEALPTSITTARLEEILAVDEAMRLLEKDYPRVVKVVELRFFMGLTEAETAAVLNLDERTVRRDWAFAKGWLALRLRAAASAA